MGFFSGSTLTLMEDIKILKPHIFPVVPRLLGKIYDGLTGKVAASGAIGRWMFARGYAAKLALLNQGIITRDTIWDALIFKLVVFAKQRIYVAEKCKKRSAATSSLW